MLENFPGQMEFVLKVKKGLKWDVLCSHMKRR